MNKLIWPFQRSLSKQLLAGFGLSLVTVSLAVLGVNYRMVQTNLEHQVQERAQSIVQGLVFATEGAIEVGYTDILRRVVQNYANLPAVMEIAIVRPDGMPLANSSALTPGHQQQPYHVLHPELAQAMDRAASTGIDTHLRTFINERAVLAEIFPFSSTLFGTTGRRGLAIAILDLRQMQQEAWQTFFTSTLTLLAGTLLILVLMGLSIKRLFLEPLNRLNQAVARSQGEGRFETPPKLPANEIQFLSTTFAQVFQQAQQSELSLRQLNADLDRKVDEQTAELLQANQQLANEIAERQQAEVEIDRFFSLSIDLLCIAGMDGFFKRLNPAFEITLGFSIQELLEHPFLDFIHPEDVASTLSEVEQLGRGKPTISFENRYRCKDGSYKWLSWVAMPFPAEGLLYAAARDVTAQKQAKAALQRANSELGKANERLQIEIAKSTAAEQELRAFTLQLERSNRELQDFAYVASHDLQEPLRKIQAFGDRLQTKFGARLTATGQDYLARMQNAAGRAQILIEDLLSFSRVTTKAQPFVPVDLEDAIAKVLLDLEISIADVGAKIILEHLPTIDADPMQMRQLFQNLISNALKFQRDGVAPEIRIQSTFLDTEGQDPKLEANGEPSHCNRQVQIAVIDNGIGFDEKYLDRIFNVFQRLHGRGTYEGTGVGLAICRKIVERHGGAISAKSIPGEGSNFIVTIPVTQSMETPQ